MREALRHALLDALSIVLPVECAGCGSPDRSLCDACRGRLAPALEVRELASGVRCITALRYEGEVRRAILAFKEEPRPGLARHFAPAVEAVLRCAPDDAEVLTVPTSRAAWRRRGFDPVRTLARAAGYRSAAVLRVANGTRQKTLGVRERAANRAGTMRARHPLEGRRFVVLDDVQTTGATLDEAIRAVRRAGGDVVLAGALAFTPRLFARR